MGRSVQKSKSFPIFGAVAGVALSLLMAGSAIGQKTLFDSDFDGDTVDLPPATGGVNQPSGIVGVGVVVRASANGIATQPLEVDDGSCITGYLGGVYYDLPAPITAGETCGLGV